MPGCCRLGRDFAHTERKLGIRSLHWLIDVLKQRGSALGRAITVPGASGALAGRTGR
jgi:hypothetical protein